MRNGPSSVLLGDQERGAVGGTSGQSLVEFAMFLPVLLLLLLTVADFGRYFAAGITIESVARTAAELTAREYLREEAATGGGALSPAAYARVHAHAWQTVCNEAADLPGIVTGGSDNPCSGIATVVCVHDFSDPGCANSYNDGGGIPSGCAALAPAARPNNAIGGSSEASRYVEVRVCYEFETILPVEIPGLGGPLTPLQGAFDIERDRVFTVVDY